MPITALTTLLGALVMLFSWVFIGRRMMHDDNGGTHQAKLLHAFFLYMAVFFVFMFAPHAFVKLQPGSFPLAMALGYVIGHVFMYLGLINILRLFFSIVPRLSGKDNLAVLLGLVATIGITVFTALTMIWGVQPEFDYDNGVTLFNVQTGVGAAIALFSAVTVLPTAILMILNGISNPATRIRSFLLGGGLFVLMTGGPLHDIAKTSQLFMLADVVSVLGLILIASGVTYRISEHIGLSKTASAITR